MNMDIFQGYDRFIGNETKGGLQEIGKLIRKKVKTDVVFMKSNNSNDTPGAWLGLEKTDPMDASHLKPIKDRLKQFNYVAQQSSNTSPMEKALAVAGQLAQSSNTKLFIKGHFKTICFSKGELHSALNPQSCNVDGKNIQFAAMKSRLYIALGEDILSNPLESASGLDIAKGITDVLRETVGVRAKLRKALKNKKDNKQSNEQ